MTTISDDLDQRPQQPRPGRAEQVAGQASAMPRPSGGHLLLRWRRAQAVTRRRARSPSVGRVRGSAAATRTQLRGQAVVDARAGSTASPPPCAHAHAVARRCRPSLCDAARHSCRRAAARHRASAAATARGARAASAEVDRHVGDALQHRRTRRQAGSASASRRRLSRRAGDVAVGKRFARAPRSRCRNRNRRRRADCPARAAPSRPGASRPAASPRR